jgi:hypothetical protein
LFPESVLAAHEEEEHGGVCGEGRGRWTTAKGGAVCGWKEGSCRA